MPNFLAQDALLIHKGAAGGWLWNTHCQALCMGSGPNSTTSVGDPNHLDRLLGATEPVSGALSPFLGPTIGATEDEMVIWDH